MKKNIKLIIGIIIGMILVSGVSVYATLTYSAGDIAYTKSGSSTPISVSSALNELYQNKKETTDDVKNITANGNITLDKYYKNVNVNVPIPAGYIQPSGTKTITTKANNIDVSNYQYADTSGMYTSTEYQQFGNTKYQEGINANENTVANTIGYKAGIYTRKNNSKHVVTINCGFSPSTILVKTQHNTSDSNQSVYVYDKKLNSGKTYKINISDNIIGTYNFKDSTFTSSYIYDVTNTGFQFQFIDNTSNTNKNCYIQWIAFK